MTNIKTGFVHTVFFWLLDSNNKDSRLKLENGLRKLAEITEIKQAFIGQPAPTNRDVIDNSYDFSITFIFENAADQEIYQDHADHHLFINECSSLWKKVQVYDAI